MKKQRNWMGYAWTMLGLLVITAVLMSLGKQDNDSFPSASSYTPSGVRAFRELLESQGYDVHVETTNLAKPDPEALYIAFLVQDSISILDDSSLLDPPKKIVDAEDGSGDERARYATEDWEERRKEKVRPLVPVVKSGANVLLVWLPRGFHSASRMGLEGPTKIKAMNGTTYLVSSTKSDYGPYPAGMDADDAIKIWTNPLTENPYATMGKLGQSTIVEAYDGLAFTNRFIDSQDNAKYVLSLVANGALKSKKIIFLEATIGNATDPSIFAMIGPWAAGIWTQIVFLFILLIVFGAVRFGLAEERRTRQSGTRELVDALGETYARAKANHIGLTAIYEEYDRQVRSKLKLPSEAGPAERNKLIPDSLAKAFATVQAMCKERGPEHESVNAAKVLQREVEDFLGRMPKQPLRKRKRS
ncbi:MAG: hypothetical protein KF784_06730 [Fimbriimonadaceae bacterium]|nr:hypothetical protein [Fimbriimonadaceae bacterium]